MDGLYTPNSIRTFKGHFLNFERPAANDIWLVDIIHQLAHTPRFAGATKEFYSVAQHSVLVASLVPEEDRIHALLHDATEAYMTDIPKPLKNLLPDFMRYEEDLEYAILERFGLETELPESVKLADEMALRMEWNGLVLGKDVIKMEYWSIAEARMRLAKELLNIEWPVEYAGMEEDCSLIRTQILGEK